MSKSKAINKITEIMGEFIFKTGELIEWQKWLNQWRHNYELKIHFIEIKDGVNCTIATILLERTKK